MGYPELPDRAMPYHDDGTVVKIVSTSSGVLHHFSDDEMAELNDYDKTEVASDMGCQDVDTFYLVFHFPEKRWVNGVFAGMAGRSHEFLAVVSVEGSNDSTNGIDGTWESIALADGATWPQNQWTFDVWRLAVAALNPSQSYETVRLKFRKQGISWNACAAAIAHIYGHKADGETPDDIIFVAPATGDELTLPLNFHAVPAGTTSILNFALKNASDSKTAQNITLSVEDEYDIIRIAWSDTGPWETSLTIDSLAAGATSDTVYVKAEPPAPPTPLKPHRAPVVVTVGAWS